jgi:hypothetical protein
MGRQLGVDVPYFLCARRDAKLRRDHEGSAGRPFETLRPDARVPLYALGAAAGTNEGRDPDQREDEQRSARYADE